MGDFLCGYSSYERHLPHKLKWIAARGHSFRYGAATPMNRTRWIASHVLLCLTLATAEVSLAIGQVPESTQAASKIAHAVRVDSAPRLDGTLADPLWQTAEPITDFRQREPHEGQAPTERTEVRILYTRHEVYFGITCYDSDTKGIVATELRRDLSQALDDYRRCLAQFEALGDKQGAAKALSSSSTHPCIVVVERRNKRPYCLSVVRHGATDCQH